VVRAAAGIVTKVVTMARSTAITDAELEQEDQQRRSHEV
jgi:hypothetical protein